jgi:hypothetical protein
VRVGFGLDTCELEHRSVDGLNFGGRVPRRVPLNSISVVSGGLSGLCYQQLIDSTKASKVQIAP